jgi:acyl carrier protein
VSVEERLFRVLEAILGPAARSLSDADGPGTIATWDSVNHLNLILAVEAEFGVTFSTSEIPEMVSVERIRDRLGET